MFFLDEEPGRRVRRKLSTRIYGGIEEFLVVCADDGRVITAAWQLGRIQRP